MEGNKVRIPVTATFRIIDGEAVMVDAHYEDIDADLVARFLIQKAGADAIFEKEEVHSGV